MTAFLGPTKLLWDVDVLDGVNSILDETGWRHIAVFVDSILRSLEPVEGLIRGIEARGSAPPIVIERAGGEPTTAEADRLAEQLRGTGVDAIIGLGGGSVLDMAKAVAGLLTNPGSAAEYQGFDLLEAPGVPIIAIPSTSGTGSEVTWTAVLINSARELKLGINSTHILPRYALLDVRLTMSMPQRLTLSTGLDALSHAIESATARKASEVSRMVSHKSAELLMGGLPAAVADGTDLRGRRDAHLGSALAGWSVMNAGTGAAHAIAYPLGARFGVPHAEALTMLLVPVMRAIDEKAPGTYAHLSGSILGLGMSPDTEPAKSQAVIERVDSLRDLSPWVPRLADYEIGDSDIQSLADGALQLTSALDNSPVGFDSIDCLAVLDKVR